MQALSYLLTKAWARFGCRKKNSRFWGKISEKSTKIEYFRALCCALWKYIKKSIVSPVNYAFARLYLHSLDTRIWNPIEAKIIFTKNYNTSSDNSTRAGWKFASVYCYPLISEWKENSPVTFLSKIVLFYQSLNLCICFEVTAQTCIFFLIQTIVGYTQSIFINNVIVFSDSGLCWLHTLFIKQNK